MDVSPIVVFPAAFLVLMVVTTVAMVHRLRTGGIKLWQLALSLVLKAVALGALVFYWWSAARSDIDPGGYVVSGLAAVMATVLDIAWVYFDLSRLEGVPRDTAPRERP